MLSAIEIKQDEPTNPNELRLPVSPVSVNESCQRLWHKLLSTRLVNDSCQRLVNDGVSDILALDNDSCQRLLPATRANEHDMT